MFWLIKISVLTICLACSISVEAFNKYRAIPLPFPEHYGYKELVPKALNENGLVVGEAIKSTEDTDLFFWYELSEGLDTYSNEGSILRVLSLNNDNVVVGASNEYGFVWDLSSGFRQIGPPNSFASAINDLNQVILITYSPNYTADIENIKHLLPKFENSSIYLLDMPKNILERILIPRNLIFVNPKINNNGLMLFQAYKRKLKYLKSGFLVYDKNLSFDVLSNFRYCNHGVVYFNNKNDALQGISKYPSENNDVQHFYGRISCGNNFSDNIEVKESDIDLFPRAFNDRREVVGIYILDDKDPSVKRHSERGFIWNPEEGFHDLTDLIIDSKEIVIDRAVAINNRGQILARCELGCKYSYVLLDPIQ